MAQLEEKLIEEVIQELPSHGQDKQSVTQQEELLTMYQHIMNAIDINFDHFQLLIGPSGDPGFGGLLRERLSPLVASNLDFDKPLDNKLPRELAKQLILDGIFSIIHFWLTDAAFYSANQMAEFLLISRGFSPFELAGLTNPSK